MPSLTAPNLPPRPNRKGRWRPSWPAVRAHARRLFLWCCVFYVLMLAVWVTDPAAGADPARLVAGRVAVVALTMGPAFYVAGWTLAGNWRSRR